MRATGFLPLPVAQLLYDTKPVKARGWTLALPDRGSDPLVYVMQGKRL